MHQEYFLVRELGADVSQTWSEDTPVYRAADRDNLPVLHCLVVEPGPDVNQVCDGGRTPLINAAAGGNISVVRCLVELGARVRAVDDSGETALIARERSLWSLC